MILIWTTHPDKKTADKIVRSLLEKKLVACANVFPVKSSYWWKNKIQSSSEFVAVLKTRGANFQKVQAEIKRLHPYELPFVAKIPEAGAKKLEEWVYSSTK